MLDPASIALGAAIGGAAGKFAEKTLSLSAKWLAYAIESVLDTNHGSRYREYRRQWVSQYSWDNIAPQIIRLYEEVLNE